MLEWAISEEWLSTRWMPRYLQTLSCNCPKVNFYFHYKQQQQQKKPQSCIHIILPPLSFLIHSHQTFALACVGEISPAEMLLPNGHETCLQKGSPVKAFTSQPIWLAVIQQSLLNTNISYREAKASMAPWRNFLIPKCHSELTNISLCHEDREKRTTSVQCFFPPVYKPGSQHQTKDCLQLPSIYLMPIVS